MDQNRRKVIKIVSFLGLVPFTSTKADPGNIIHEVKIDNTCINCNACIRACPNSVLVKGVEKPVPARLFFCIGCKQCETVCPVGFGTIRVYTLVEI